MDTYWRRHLGEWDCGSQSAEHPDHHSNDQPSAASVGPRDSFSGVACSGGKHQHHPTKLYKSPLTDFRRRTALAALKPVRRALQALL